MPNAFSVYQLFSLPGPRVVASSNLGLKLANAFGVKLLVLGLSQNSNVKVTP
jgi:hypothetical protein